MQPDILIRVILEKILAGPEFKKAKETFHGLVTNVSDSLLTLVSEQKK